MFTDIFRPVKSLNTFLITLLVALGSATLAGATAFAQDDGGVTEQEKESKVEDECGEDWTEEDECETVEVVTDRKRENNETENAYQEEPTHQPDAVSHKGGGSNNQTTTTTETKTTTTTELPKREEVSEAETTFLNPCVMKTKLEEEIQKQKTHLKNLKKVEESLVDRHPFNVEGKTLAFQISYVKVLKALPKQIAEQEKLIEELEAKLASAQAQCNRVTVRTK